MGLERFNIDRKSANYKIVCSAKDFKQADAHASKKEFVKEIGSLLFSFAWKGKQKIKRTAFINPTEKGGLKMPDSMIGTQRLMCIKRYLNPDTTSWQPGGGQMLVSLSNFGYSKLPISLTDFYNGITVSGLQP